jgi:hypothetical protein
MAATSAAIDRRAARLRSVEIIVLLVEHRLRLNRFKQASEHVSAEHVLGGRLAGRTSWTPANGVSRTSAVAPGCGR